MNPRGNITESPFVASAVANRLKKLLTDLKIYNGETMHSFRSGCSITLSLLGVSYEQVAKHVGWRSLDTVIYYTQFNRVMATNDLSSIVSLAAQQTTQHDLSPAEQLGKEFRDKNCLNDCKPLIC